jgi:hypothetical protein
MLQTWRFGHHNVIRFSIGKNRPTRKLSEGELPFDHPGEFDRNATVICDARQCNRRSHRTKRATHICEAFDDCAAFRDSVPAEHDWRKCFAVRQLQRQYNVDRLEL